MKVRNKYLIGGALIIAIIIAFSIQELQEKTIFFYTPEEILVNPSKFENKTVFEKGWYDFFSLKIRYIDEKLLIQNIPYTTISKRFYKKTYRSQEKR